MLSRKQRRDVESLTRHLAEAEEKYEDTLKALQSAKEAERKYGDTGKYESKVECKPGRGVTRLSSGGEGKEEFRRNGCEVKREWKRSGEYKEEVKCD